jgi:hypothetical protein
METVEKLKKFLEYNECLEEFTEELFNSVGETIEEHWALISEGGYTEASIISAAFDWSSTTSPQFWRHIDGLWLDKVL